MSSAIREDGAIIFSIIADEVTERHTDKEILSLCLRLVSCDYQTPSKHINVVFFYFTFLTTTTGLAISNAIKKESLCTYNVDISNARGQA